MTPIIPLSQIASAYAGASSDAAANPIASAAGAGNGLDFGDMVGNAAKSAIQTMHQAEQTTAAGVAGKADVQSVVQALSSAEVTMQTVVTIRDKVLSAYNDVMHMAI